MAHKKCKAGLNSFMIKMPLLIRGMINYHNVRETIMKTPMMFAVLLFAVNVSAQPPQNNRPIDVIVQPVAVIPVQTELEAIGNLYANESIEITANLNKKITGINFNDGQRVKRGHILVEMTSHEERALLAEARVNSDEAKKQWERVDSLAKTGAASQSLLDQRLREYEAAQARYNAIESRLKDLLLQAPFAGVVGLRQVSVGALVSPGEVITTLNDDSKMKLDFTVPSIYLSSLSYGLSVKAKTRDLNNKVLIGTVASVDNQIDPVTRAIKVRAILENPEHELKQGMLMEVTLKTKERQSMVISESALMPLASNNFVFVVKESAEKKLMVERKKIEIGQRLVGFVEVTSGLEEGEKVVTHGVQKLRGGQSINILSEEKPASVKPRESHLSDLIQSKKTEVKPL
jgi:membrane fusion protein, multidrug efflux system